MREEAEELKDALVKNFGDVIKFRYIDVRSEELKEYPQVVKILDKVRLPLTVINGEPRFHGGFSYLMISDAIRKILNEE